MTVKDDLILRAESWAASLWSAALTRWTVREGQDKSFRQHVVHPVILSVLGGHFPGKKLRILDLGCGDGILLEDQRVAELMEDGGAYLGIDSSEKLITHARNRHTAVRDCFLRGNLSDPSLTEVILSRGSAWDCAMSVFVIQEMPDIMPLLNTLSNVLPPGALAVFVTVHPEFAQWLAGEGRMKKEENLEGDAGLSEIRWRWAGYYPIVDEPLEAFYLPYFHRSVDDYGNLLSKSGFVTEKIMEFPDKSCDLPRLIKDGISPFVPFPANLYWPRIVEEPSTLAIIARKEG